MSPLGLHGRDLPQKALALQATKFGYVVTEQPAVGESGRESRCEDHDVGFEVVMTYGGVRGGVRAKEVLKDAGAFVSLPNRIDVPAGMQRVQEIKAWQHRPKRAADVVDLFAGPG